MMPAPKPVLKVFSLLLLISLLYLLNTVALAQASSSANSSDLATDNPNSDLNYDNKVDIFDVLEWLKIFKNQDSYPLLAGDVNSDNKTDIFDLLALLKEIKSNQPITYQISGKILGIHAGDPEYHIVPYGVVQFKDLKWNLIKADTADTNGNFSLRLNPGNYFMCVSAEDYHNYPQIEEKNPHFVWYYFDTHVNSNMEKNGIILNDDIDIELFSRVFKDEDVTGNKSVGIPLLKWDEKPTNWIQENTKFPTAKQTLNDVIEKDYTAFQSELEPEIVEDSLQANVKHYFVPSGHPRIGNSSWASYAVYGDVTTNTIEGARIWYFDALDNDDFSKGIYREEVSQSHENLSDIFNPDYSRTTLYHDSQIARDFTKLDKDNIGTIYHLLPKGY